MCFVMEWEVCVWGGAVQYLGQLVNSLLHLAELHIGEYLLQNASVTNPGTVMQRGLPCLWKMQGFHPIGCRT